MNITKDYESVPSVKRLLDRPEARAFQQAVEQLDKNLRNIPVNYAELEDDLECYLLPVNRAMVVFLEKLLGYSMSESMACDECAQTLVDNLLRCLAQAKFNLLAQPFISIYRVDKHYGGPEECGWYYNAWTLESTRSIPYDEVSGYLASLAYKYSGNKSSPSHGKLLSIYRLFCQAAQPQLDRYRLEHFEKVGDFVWAPRCAQAVPLWYDDDEVDVEDARTAIYAVFEWAPGQLSTTHRPQYC